MQLTGSKITLTKQFNVIGLTALSFGFLLGLILGKTLSIALIAALILQIMAYIVVTQMIADRQIKGEFKKLGRVVALVALISYIISGYIGSIMGQLLCVTSSIAVSLIVGSLMIIRMPHEKQVLTTTLTPNQHVAAEIKVAPIVSSSLNTAIHKTHAADNKASQQSSASTAPSMRPLSTRMSTSSNTVEES